MDEQSIVRGALKQAAGEVRDKWLDEACGDDTALRDRVEKLLAERELEIRVDGAAPESIVTQITGKPVSEPAASLEADPERASDEDAVPGNTTHSVLKSLSLTIDVPRVALREFDDDGDGPITRPQSPEMPRSDSDSRYQLQGEIARGGMGAILKGRDTDLGRDLAVKVLLEKHTERPEVVQRFIEEAQIGGQLQHPGIAPVYELGQFADRRPFFSMKLIKGRTLSKLLSARQSASADRARFLGIFEQVCQTMAYAHSRGVIHRDLKPSNVMVGAFGEVQVMDWGLAKVLPTGGVADEKKSRDTNYAKSIIQTIRSFGSDTPGAFGSGGSDTQMGSVIGTPAYMPPEQALGEIDVIDERSDVFGLGAILTEILTGEAPYTGEDGTQIFRLASRGKLDECFQRLDGSEADPELIQLTKQCLELEPVDRPQNAGAVAERMTEYLESVETRLREAEVQRAAEAARADAEAAQAAAERQRADAEAAQAAAERQRAEAEAERAAAESLRAQEEQKRRRTGLALAASILLLVGVGGGGLLYVVNSEAKRQIAEADVQRKHAADMQQLAEQRDEQRKAAEQAEQTALAAKAEVDRALSVAEQDREAAIAAQKVAEAAKERGRRLQYATDMQLVPLLWRDRGASIAQLKSRLDSHNPELNPELQGKEDLRSFEWYYYQNLVNNSDAVFSGHGSAVADGTLTSDGQLVTLSETNEVRFWDLLSGEEDEPRRRTLTAAFGNQTRTLSPDGRLMAVTTEDEVHLLDVGSGELVWKIDSQSYGSRWLAFSADSKQLVVVDGEIRWLNATTGDVIGSLDGAGSPRKGISLSLDGLTLALVGTGGAASHVAVFRLNPSDGKVVRQMPDIDNLGTVGTAAVSPDGKLVAVGSGYEGFLKIYEADTGRRIAQHSSAHRAPISALAFSEDGAQLSSAGTDGTINVWTNLEQFNSSSKPVGTLKGHSSATTRLRYSSDGRQLVSTSQDGSARVWDVTNIGVSIAWALTGNLGFPSASFSPDGSLCAVAHGSQVSLFDTSSGQRVRVLVGQSDLQAASVSFSPTDQALLAVGYGGKKDVSFVALWDIDKAAERTRLSIVNELPGSSVDESRGVAGTLCFSPDGQHLVAGIGSRFRYNSFPRPTPLLVWDVRERRLIQKLAGHTGHCVSLDFSSDGKLLASGSHDGIAIIWSTGTWQELSRFRNPDSRTMRENRQLRALNDSVVVNSVAFSPDNKTLAMATQEGSVHLWNVASGNRLTTLTGHSNAVKGVAFDPSGRTLASTSVDGTVRLWNMATHRELMELDSGKLPVGRGTTVAFSPDGKQLLAGGTTNVLTWSAAPREWQMTRRPARQLESLLASNKDFRGAVRLGSRNVRLHLALETLDSTDVRVAAALAATRALWHASKQRWAEAAKETERFRETESGTLDGWLDSQGVIRVAEALLHNGQPSEASDLIATVDRNLKRDGVTRTSLIGIRSELGSFPVRLNAVYSGTPAARSGLRIGDTILKVNDQEFTADNANQFTSLLKGDPGTRIQLLVRHSDSDQDEQIELIKELVLSDTQVRDQIQALRDEVQVRLSEDSPSAGLLSLRAELRGLVGRVSEKVADYTQAINLLSSNADNQAAAGLGRLYRRRGDARLKRKEWSLALEDYNRVVNDETVDEDLLVNHAAAQTGVILDELDSQIDDGITDPWVRLAAAWQLKDDQPAIDEVVRQRPQLAGAIGDLFLQGDSKNITRAIDVFSVGITANEKDSELLIKRARAYEETGNWEAAIADWSRAATDDFRGAQLFAELARRLVPTEFHTQAEAQRTEAKRILQGLLETDPNDGPVIETLTQVLLDQLEFPQWTVLRPATAKTEGGADVQIDTDGSIKINSSETDSLALLAGETDIKSIRIESEASSDSPQTGTAEFITHRVEPVGVHRSPGGGVSGRYVRIDLPGVNVDVLGGNTRSAVLRLTEVQIFQEDRNIAFGKDARMSHPWETPGVYPPEIAVDGDKASYVDSEHRRRFSPFGSDVQPSWEVDLAEMQAIDRIVVWNQGEADLIQLRVRVLDSERNIVFEEFIERGQAPSTEVDCHSLLTSAPTDGDPAEPRLVLRIPTGFAGTTTGKRFRVSGTNRLLPLDHDIALADAANIRAGAGRLAAALAIAGDVDMAVKWFEAAFDQTDLTHERRAAIQFLRGHRDIVMELLKRRPDDFDIQIAATRHLIAQGKTALAAGNSADGLTELRNADDILSRLLDTGTGWTALKPIEAASGTATGSQLDFQNDLSVFVKKAAVNDTFTLEFDAPAERVSGLRLEALTDPRLKEGGPGVRGYFSLRSLLLKGIFPKSSASDSFSSIDIRDAWADRNGLSNTLRGTLRAGLWSIFLPEAGEPYVAVFETRDTQDKGSPSRLQLQLLHAGPNAMGRFRVSATSDPATVRSSRLRLAVTDDYLVDFYVALGTACARESLPDDATDAFGRAVEFCTNLNRAMAVVSAAAPHGDVIETLADRFKGNVHWQAALAQGLSRHGQKDLVESARNAAREGFEQKLIEDPKDESTIEDLSELLFDAVKQPTWLPVTSEEVATPDGQPVATDSVNNLIVGTARAKPASLVLPPLPDSVKAVRIETGSIESTAQAVTAPLKNYRVEFLNAPRSESGSLLGRYVRVEKPEDSNRYPRSPDDMGYMNFAEVEVFGGQTNLALGKEARQTATWDGNVPERAVDGNKSGVLNDKSIAHSGYVENESAWWEVDLGAVQSIDRIVFWNRTDRYWSARTNYVRIRVLDEQRKIIFEQLVGRAPRPSCEIDCHSLLSTVDSTAEGETRWSFRVPGTASFESLTRCRISVAEKIPPLEQDDMVYSARNVPADSRRVAAAYAINGLAPGRLEQQPDDGDLNVALIRHATAKAQLALSSNSLDEMLPELELAGKVADKLTAAPPAWTVLSPVEMSSQNGSKLELQDDRSVFVSAPTDKDVYSLVFETELEAIKAIRLEALADSRLPGNGPGHFDGTFVLSGLSIEAADGDRPGQTELLRIHRARADYSQVFFPVENSIDGDDSKGWAIQPRTGENHTAVFEIDETRVKHRPARVTVRVKQLSGYKKNLLGRFRVSFTDEKSVTENTKVRLRLSESELADFYVALGTARALVGQQDDAVGAFVRALNLSPDHETKARILAACAVSPEVQNQVTGEDEGRAAAQDLDVQLALARLSSVRGQQALVAGKPAEALVELKRADELFTKLLGAPTQWHALTPLELSSEEGSKLKLLDDGSIFVSDPADQDVFSMTFQSDLKGIQGLRLETLPDSDLGGFHGPGLGEAGNFVLTGLAVEAASDPQRNSPVAISFQNAWADYSEEGFNVQGVLDGSPDSGWKISPQINQIHTAVFEAAKEAGGDDLSHLKIQLAHESSFEHALIGRFRLSLTDDPATPKLTGLQLALKDDELADAYIALGTAFAQQDMLDDAADAFSRGIQQIGERSVSVRVVTVAATWPEVLKTLATSNDVPVLAALARHHARQGDGQQAAVVRDMARALLEKQRADAPTDPMLVAELADVLLGNSDVKWTVIKPDKMQSTGGATLTPQPDGSILAVGYNPAKDSYAVTGLSALKRITAIQLEALTDPSLPHKGPGRVGNGNFNLDKFEILAQGDPQRSTDIHASFRSGRYLHSIIDGPVGDRHWSGWGMVGRENSLLLATDFERAIDDELEFKLLFSRTLNEHNLGRFRLLASDDPQAFEREKQRFEARNLADPWQRLAAAYRFIGDQAAAEKLLQQMPTAEQENPE